MITFKPISVEAIEYVAENMREADAEEVWASSMSTPKEALLSSIAVSDYVNVAYADDTPLVIFGLVKGDVLSGRGTPWLLGTEDALKYKRQFLLQTPAVIREMLTICPVLENFVHDKNRVSIRWLRWLGFTIEAPQATGVNGEMFHRFYMRKEGCATLH